jgi:DNA-binding transcriptional MerR regulator
MLTCRHRGAILARVPNDPTPPTYSLGDLADLTGIPERTIRSYIGRNLLPPPDGRGRAASYGPAHLESLQFLQRVRAAVPYELPLAVLERLLRELPPEQIARIARGEEGVMAVPVMQELDPTFMRRKRAEAEPLELRRLSADLLVHDDLAPYSPGRREEQAAQTHARRTSIESSLAGAPAREEPSMHETWTTLQVTPNLRLSMRGQAPAIAKRLTALAERLRGWLSKEDSA